MKKGYPELSGELKVFSAGPTKDEPWISVTIEGDPQGLRSLAKILEHLADYDQENDSSLPFGCREHCSIGARFLLRGSHETVLSRIDPKKGPKGSAVSK